MTSAERLPALPDIPALGEFLPGFEVSGWFGIAASDTLGVWGEHLIAQADAAVYLAKRLGRNQVQMAARLAA